MRAFLLSWQHHYWLTISNSQIHILHSIWAITTPTTDNLTLEQNFDFLINCIDTSVYIFRSMTWWAIQMERDKKVKPWIRWLREEPRSLFRWNLSKSKWIKYFKNCRNLTWTKTGWSPWMSSWLLVWRTRRWRSPFST